MITATKITTKLFRYWILNNVSAEPSTPIAMNGLATNNMIVNIVAGTNVIDADIAIIRLYTAIKNLYTMITPINLAISFRF